MENEEVPSFSPESPEEEVSPSQETGESSETAENPIEEIPQQFVFDPEEFKKYAENAVGFMDSYKNFLNTFAQDTSLKMAFSNKFMIDMENGIVHFNTKWFFEQGYSNNQILWAALHELAHFRVFVSDPEGVKDSFAKMQEQAKVTGALLKDRYQGDGEIPDEQTPMETEIKTETPQKMDRFEMASYKMIHSFYNCLEDIYVNNLVSRRASKFSPDQSGGKEVFDLYREKLFPNPDMTDLPRHLQYANSLLRGEMVPDEELNLSEEIKEVLEKKIEYKGKEYTAKELIDTFLKPSSQRDTGPRIRNAIINQTLLPIFLDLLHKDIAEFTPPPPEEKEEQEQKQNKEQDEQTDQTDKKESEVFGDIPEFDEENQETANPFEKDYRRFEEANPDKFSDEEIDQWLDGVTNPSEEPPEEVPETAEQKATRSQEDMDEKWCEENDIPLETFYDFKRIEEKVAPYLDDLSQLWQHIIFGQSRGIEHATEGGFPTGTSLDVNKVIESWPKIQKGQFEDVKVMQRQIEKETLTTKPEKIRVRILADNSGSMEMPINKLETLKESIVLLLSSLNEFNTQLNLNRSRTKSNLTVETEAWTFGDESNIIKSLGSDSGNERAEIIRCLEKLDASGGGTDDADALEQIRSGLDEREIDLIEQKKLMEITFEITDGAPNSPQDTRNEIDQLQNLGVVIRAFQIGDTNEWEKQIFRSIWNSDRPKPLGEIVGAKIGNLTPAVTSSLKEFLADIRI